MVWLLGTWKSCTLGDGPSSAPGSPWFFSLSLAAASLFGLLLWGQSWEQLWVPGLAGGTSWAGDVLQPRSELVPKLWGPVHAKERGWLPHEVSFPFHERGEGGDTVANKVVSLAKDVQVDLGHLRLQAHHFHLQEEG